MNLCLVSRYSDRVLVSNKWKEQAEYRNSSRGLYYPTPTSLTILMPLHYHVSTTCSTTPKGFGPWSSRVVVTTPRWGSFGVELFSILSWDGEAPSVFFHFAAFCPSFLISTASPTSSPPSLPKDPTSVNHLWSSTLLHEPQSFALPYLLIFPPFSSLS